jgi:hypothetical protein
MAMAAVGVALGLPRCAGAEQRRRQHQRRPAPEGAHQQPQQDGPEDQLLEEARLDRDMAMRQGEPAWGPLMS